MLRGLTTVNFIADDLAAAQSWYTNLLGVEPYFVREIEGTPAYIEYRVGDFEHEIGFIDARFAAPDNPSAGAGTFWAVDDVDAAFARLVELGATAIQEPTEYGPGFVTAVLADPFGNVLGVMYNKHYLDVVDARPRV